jgi:hypothetical protein
MMVQEMKKAVQVEQEELMKTIFTGWSGLSNRWVSQTVVEMKNSYHVCKRVSSLHLKK